MVGMGTAAREVQVEYLDVLTKAGAHTGVSKPRSLVHKEGDYHRAVHVWIYVESTGQLLLQKRADCKESWPGLWDISSAGHIAAGDTSLITARRELQEELGINFPDDAFEILFVYLQECVINDGTYINNEYNDVYLVTIFEPLPLEAFSLQESEVSDVKYIAWRDYEEALRTNNSAYVPFDADGQYGLLFKTLRRRYEPDVKVQINSLQNQLGRYVPVLLEGELAELSAGDTLALSYTIQAAEILERLFLEQV
ncbi:hypothetical protein O6H91_13G004500 [Diphasiastrum complanatum]|uniref:Uncharacterized protein n=1 Tax=Diphasiastrum complanatum TaxID=34168 RepID=A0ACC2BSH2_DIPCM|nr:hypothetical protein O6H91_13G004500 [Diphasiastrum complanatum]